LSFGPGEGVCDGAETRRLEFVSLRSRGFDKSIEVETLDAQLGSLECRPQRLFAADPDKERLEFDELA
jgi:hypothetical protein